MTTELLSERQIFDEYILKNSHENYTLPQDIEILDIISHRYSTFELSALLQKRSVREGACGCHPSEVQKYPRQAVKAEDVKLWDVEVAYNTDFTEQSFYKRIDGSELIEDCYDCNLEGSIKCYKCDGLGKKHCLSCKGNGKDVCSACDGRALKFCSRCNGSGLVEMDKCSSCAGIGKNRCSKCLDGYLICKICHGLSVLPCDFCDGLGKTTCRECDGYLKILNYTVLDADNFVVKESYEDFNSNLSVELLKHFKPHFSIKSKEIDTIFYRDRIEMQDISSNILESHSAKMEELVNNVHSDISRHLSDSCRLLQMGFKKVDIKGLFTVHYCYSGVEYSVSFLRHSTVVHNEGSPWNDHVGKIVKKLQGLLDDNDRRFALEEVNREINSGITSKKLEKFRDGILAKYRKRDFLLIFTPYFIPGMVWLMKGDNFIISTLVVLVGLVLIGIIIHREENRKKW